MATNEAHRNGELVLFADDDASVRAVFEFVLRQHGYEVALARDGEEAVALAVAKRPRIAFLDMWMPRMNGLEACAAIRKMLGHGLLVAVMSGDDAPQLQWKALDAGASIFLLKPFEHEQMLRLVDDAFRPWRLPTESAAGGDARH